MLLVRGGRPVPAETMNFHWYATFTRSYKSYVEARKSYLAYTLIRLRLTIETIRDYDRLRCGTNRTWYEPTKPLIEGGTCKVRRDCGLTCTTLLIGKAGMAGKVVRARRRLAGVVAGPFDKMRLVVVLRGAAVPLLGDRSPTGD